MQVEVQLTFEVGHCNGSMSLQVFGNNQQLFTRNDLTEQQISLDLNLDLPGTIKIVLGNKNNNTDTRIDHNGQVLQDKYIKLSEMTVARVPVKSSVLFDLCNYLTETGQQSQDTYWGWNGTVQINLNESTPVTWHLKNNL